MMQKPNKRRWYVLILLVALGAAGLEWPELITLEDDTSNDPELVETAQARLLQFCAIRLQRNPRLTAKGQHPLPLAVQSSRSGWPAVYSAKSGQDLLRFLTLQRK